MPSVGPGVLQGLNNVGQGMQDLATNTQNMDLNKQKQALMSQTMQQNAVTFQNQQEHSKVQSAIDTQWLTDYNKEKTRRDTPIDLNKIPKDNAVINTLMGVAKQHNFDIKTTGGYEDALKFANDHPDILVGPSTQAYQQLSSKLNAEMPAINASQKKISDLMAELSAPETDLDKKAKLQEQINKAKETLQAKQKELQPLQQQSSQLLSLISRASKQSEAMTYFGNFEQSDSFYQLNKEQRQLYDLAKAKHDPELFSKGMEKMAEETSKREEMRTTMIMQMGLKPTNEADLALKAGKGDKEAERALELLAKTKKDSKADKRDKITIATDDNGNISIIDLDKGEVVKTIPKAGKTNPKKQPVFKPKGTGTPQVNDTTGRPMYLWKKDGRYHYTPEPS